MAAQPKSRASANRERNAHLLRSVLTDSEPRLRRHAGRHAASPEDAEDALQSAYALFIERYRGDCDPLAWLYTTVKREAWRIRRRASRRREVSLDAPCPVAEGERAWIEALAGEGPGPCDLAIRIAELAERQRLLAELKPDERRALLLLGIGFSYAEICQLTGWSHTKVNRCIAEGRAAVRKELAAAGG